MERSGSLRKGVIVVVVAMSRVQTAVDVVDVVVGESRRRGGRVQAAA